MVQHDKPNVFDGDRLLTITVLFAADQELLLPGREVVGIREIKASFEHDTQGLVT